MKKKINLYMILGLSFLVLFLILFALLNVDKAKVGISEVGLSSINKLVDYKYNGGWQIVADVFLYLGLAAVAVLAGIGAYQLFKRKSLFKVDRFISIFGIFFIIAAILWIMFDKVLIVNYRPIYYNGELESSFPSTHTFVVTFIFLSLHGMVSILTSDYRYKVGSLCIAVLAITLVSLSRVLAGMHYLTDVCGGLLLGLSLYFTCFGIIKANKEEEVDE